MVDPRGVAYRRRKNSAWRIVLAGIVMGVISFVFIEVRLKPTLSEVTQARATAVATSAVNSALSETVFQDIHYEDLMHWKTDSQGNVVAVQANTGEINRIAAFITGKVQEVLRQIKNVRVSVPMGQVFGSALLSNLGPWLNVTVVPIGVVNTTVTDSFETAGINQLRHKICLEVDASVRVLVPLVSSNVHVHTSMPIAEAIILGDVPNVYVSIPDAGSNVLKGVIP